MYQNNRIKLPARTDYNYVIYFYESGLSKQYQQRQKDLLAGLNYGPAGSYDFSSDLSARRPWPKPQTVEQIVSSGYLSIPKGKPETAIISDRKNTSWLGLDDIRSILTDDKLSAIISDIESTFTDIDKFDLVGIDIEDEKRQLKRFIQDIKINAENLKKDLDERVLDVGDYINKAEATADGTAKVDALLEAGKILLGEDFQIVPEFGLSEEQASEWQNAHASSGALLSHQKNEMQEAFPVDTWLYGIARVREKMKHLENLIVLAEAIRRVELKLEPVQFPYLPEDYWLALEYPKVDSNGDPFVIDEDKLLYTALGSTSFNNDKKQCGLLVDEWTEVIPSEEETTGITFHYDRPNSEPPQTLLLVTPSEFSSAWQWNDLVDTLHETLDMAKTRAIEPTHIDTTDYARFLPAIVSAVTVFPITLSMNLALNNEFYKLKE